VGYGIQLWGVMHYLVLWVLQEVEVGYIAYGGLHVTEYVIPNAHNRMVPINMSPFTLVDSQSMINNTFS
jgi:hypothetical protein